MHRLVLLSPALLLGGCIIYDNTGTCPRGDCDVWADTGGLGLGEEEAVPEPVFTLSPDEATVGESFIASLTAENFDVATVESVEVYGNATVTAQVVREDELLLTIVVSAEAQPGDVVDLLLNVGNDAIWAEAALSVVEPSTEEGSGGAEDEGSGSGGGAGDGSGSSGSGSDTGDCE